MTSCLTVLHPEFEEHFPVFTLFASKGDPIPAERRIDSEDPETGRIETTAMCGRHVACSYAPITCYACVRFIPCYDADHSINLHVVDQEIQGAECKGLAMQHEVKRWKTIRNYIRLVIAACETKRMAMEQEAARRAAMNEVADLDRVRRAAALQDWTQECRERMTQAVSGH